MNICLLIMFASVTEQITEQLPEQAIEQITQQTERTIDLSLVVALAALALSVLSPFLSALLNGHYRIKERKLDISYEKEKQHQQFYDVHRAEAIEHYIRAVSNRIAGLTLESESDYFASMSEVLLYLDESLWKYVLI